MPWKITSLVRARQQLVELMLARRQTIQTLCRRFNVSRKTAYKWRARFRQRGVLGLRDHSRRPRRSPRRLAATWVKVIRQWHRRRSHWGPKKIRHRLRQIFPRRCVPCARSIQRCLQRWQRGTPRPRRARKGPRLPTPGLTRPTRPNQVWTVDFKGWFRTADGQRQEPLTVRDLFSRFGLCVRLLPSQDDARVRQVFQRLFRQRGLPASIRADNGSPFAGTGALGLSRLSVWWLRLGIRVEFTRRARPGDNAAHEQFHGCYQRQVVATGGSHRRSMQPRSTRWLRDYNQDRPHEALNQRTPAEVYRPSRRPYPRVLPPLVYPKAWGLRRVRNRGQVHWQGRLQFIGRAFVGQRLGFKPTGEQQGEVYLGKQLIGQLHSKDAGGLRPAHWQRQESLKVN